MSDSTASVGPTASLNPGGGDPTTRPFTGDQPADLAGPADLPADFVPGYEIESRLAVGGMGVVYKGRQQGLNRPVAIKMVLGAGQADDRAIIRFLAEADAIGAIRHPNVVQVYDFGEVAGRPFLALEFCEGGTLADRLKAGRLPARAAAELLATLAGAVQAAHELGIVHRDLKPGNVLFDAGGTPKVADFGLAKRAGGSDLTRTQAVMGTPAYMAPEQAKGETKFVGPPADVWALGVILYECLTGARPFTGTDPFDVARKVIEATPRPPRAVAPDVSRDLGRVCEKCLEKDPAQRYPTAATLADDLARFLAGRPITVRPHGLLERGLKWSRRNRRLVAVWGLTAAVLTFGGLGAAFATLWRQAEQARKEADGVREELAHTEYGRTLQLAHEEIRQNNLPVSEALLASTRADLRGWEWRYLKRVCRAELVRLEGFPQAVLTLHFSPDRRHLVTLCKKDVAVWDVGTGHRVWVGTHEESVWQAAYSADGTRLLTTTHGFKKGDGRVVLWDAVTGDRLASWAADVGLGAEARLSADGRRVAVRAEGGGVQVWDARTGEKEFLLTGTGGLHSPGD